jgi:hypothetical protein
MGLTWRDTLATVFMGAIVAIYVAFLNGTHAWLISSARGTAAAVGALGMFGACAISATRDLHTGPQPQGGRAYRASATTGGVVAFVAAVAGLITGSTVALAVLVAVTVALWFIATTRHALTAPAGPARLRDTHEVIHQGDAAQH